ncbi:uncharacterized protein LOC121097393 [Falco naumanni]|uniref:uncharacterized protein LOC121097393 n=1 Tax=Falco naumanni TaxID=148594 RepID=UPI001ADE5C23|nr:uncharacterized protein LOC121097393 [Falco naumanni]
MKLAVLGQDMATNTQPCSSAVPLPRSVASPPWGLSVPGSAPLTASNPSLARRRCGCKQPGCLQGCDVNRRVCLATSEQGGQGSDAEHQTGQVGRMGHGLGRESNTHRIRYLPGEQRGGCSCARCCAPCQQCLFLREMLVPRCLLQHLGAHTCRQPGLRSCMHLGHGLGVLGQHWHQPRPWGCPGSWLSPRAVPSPSPRARLPPPCQRTNATCWGQDASALRERGGDTSRSMGHCLGKGHRQLLLPSGMAGFVPAILIWLRMCQHCPCPCWPMRSAFLHFTLLKSPPLVSECWIPFAGGRDASPAECVTPGMKRVLSPS